MKITKGRVLILELLKSIQGKHWTAQEIYEEIKKASPQTGLASVYRTLDFFVTEGLVSVADIGRGTAVYEVVSNTPHHHFVCERCKKIQDIPTTLVNEMFNKINEKQSIKINTNHLILFGYCTNCK